MSYFDESNRILYSGDTAYLGPMYSCFEGGDQLAFAASIKRLAALPEVEMICPGHNDPITDHKWLDKLSECVEMAIAGDIQGRARDDFVVGREFRFDKFSVWLPK